MDNLLHSSLVAGENVKEEVSVTEFNAASLNVLLVIGEKHFETADLILPHLQAKSKN